MKKIKETAGRTVDTIKGFAQNPIENLGFLIPITMMIVSIICALVGYILFIVHGGYLNQVSLIKEFGTDGISQGFTLGSSGMMTSGNITKAIWILFLAQMVVMLISYFMNVGKAKKIIMIIDLVVLALVIAAFVFVFVISIGSLVFSEEQLMTVLSPFEGMTVNLKAILITYAVLTAASVITFIVLILISDCRWMLGYGLLSLAANYIALPLVVLLLENIIPMISGIVVIAIIGLVIFIAFKLFLGGSGEGSSASGGGSSYSNNNSYSRKVSDKKVNTGNLSEHGEKKRQARELVIEETCAYVPDLNSFGGFKLFKVHGFTEDYIESDNGIATRRICSLEWFQKGKYHIYESKSGREVKDSEIPWRKQN